MFAYEDGETTAKVISEDVISYMYCVRILFGNIRDFQEKDIFAKTIPITLARMSIILLETGSQ